MLPLVPRQRPPCPVISSACCPHLHCFACTATRPQAEGLAEIVKRCVGATSCLLGGTLLKDLGYV